MTARGVPPANWHIDSALVRGLLDEQHPDLAHLPIEPFASGWSRARGWALSFAAMLLDAGVAEDADYAAMGEHVIRQLGAGD